MNLELIFLTQGNIPQQKSMNQPAETSQISLFKIFKNIISSLFSVEKKKENNPKPAPVITHIASMPSVSRKSSFIEEMQKKEIEAISEPRKLSPKPLQHIALYPTEIKAKIRAYEQTKKDHPLDSNLQIKALEELIKVYNSYMSHPQYKTQLNPLLRDAFSEENSEDKIDEISTNYAQRKEVYENLLNALKTP